MEAAEEYLKPKRQIARLRGKMNEAKEDLVHAMIAADVTEFLIDDGEKLLSLEHEDKVLVKARKKAGADGEMA
jgi:hypothetical protein